jgi:hypothetical protein
MKIHHLLIVTLMLAVLVVPALGGMAFAQAPASSVTPVPWEGPTALPDYLGTPARIHPIPPANAPQNPFLSPNPFSNYHNDTWMSDTYDIAGPLGRDPQVFSSDLSAARHPTNPPSFLFHCGTLAFDRYGRIVTICSNTVQTTAVMVDPDTLEVLASQDLPAAGNPTSGLGAGYSIFDNLERLWTAIGDKLVKVSLTGGLENPGLSFDPATDQIDLSAVVPAGDVINSLVPDFEGRIWFVVRYSGIIGLLDPATGTVQTLKLDNGEQIANSFSVDGTDAYIVSTRQLYRLSAGDDNLPYVVWSAGYQNDYPVTPKPGQISGGSGTTPTILDHGKYVAIADNAHQTHIVVYRTAEQLRPWENRVLCEAPVFEPGKGAVEDSLIGSGRTLIVSNNYGYIFYPGTLVAPVTEPGVARVDISPNGKSCEVAWTNTQVNPGSYGAKLSTRTGLVYVVSRKYDETRVTPTNPGMDAWYFSAIDFRTGETVWEKLAGTGRWFDGYWPLVILGPNGALYADGYAGIYAIRDTR